jgi:hypothetical protein
MNTFFGTDSRRVYGALRTKDSSLQVSFYFFLVSFGGCFFYKHLEHVPWRYWAKSGPTFLLRFCCFPAALLLLYCCFTAALLLRTPHVSGTRALARLGKLMLAPAAAASASAFVLLYQ